MQAPHNPAPQPNLVPVSFKPSRITQSNGVSGGASVDVGAPFTTKFVIIDSSLTPAGTGQMVLVQSFRGEKGMAMAKWRREFVSANCCMTNVRFTSGSGHRSARW
jgi:hypothetical protein